MVVAEPKAPLQDEADMRMSHRRLDADGNGSICMAELRGALRALGAPLSDADCERMMGLLDADGSKNISYEV